MTLNKVVNQQTFFLLRRVINITKLFVSSQSHAKKLISLIYLKNVKGAVVEVLQQIAHEKAVHYCRCK